MKKLIYLDYAAATPMDLGVLEAMRPYFTDDFYNPSATYLAGRSTKIKLENIRQNAAMILGAKPAEIIFTAGATEANNLAVQGVMNQYPAGELLISSIEHGSVLVPAELFPVKKISADSQGNIKLDKVADMITDKTVMVSVILVNNELGTIQSISEIAKMLQKIKDERLAVGNQLPIYLHTDAAQAGNYLDLHVSRLGVDMMSINGGKIYGPKQAGIFYVKSGVKLKPLILGGGQEFGLRSGTENLAAAAGMVYALENASQKRKSEAKRISALRENFEKSLAENLPEAIINGSKTRRSPHIISVTIPGTDNERLMMELDESGIQCAVGSACSASREEVSHVLSAIGLSETQARSTLRFSLGRGTTQNVISNTIQKLTELTASNR